MLQHIGTPELLLIAVVLLLMFGGKKLPELARGIAESVTSVRKAVKDEA